MNATENVKATAFIVPVWGDSYIEGFLEVGLQSLLAEGNFPALPTDVKSALKIVTHSKHNDELRRRLNDAGVERFVDVILLNLDDITSGVAYKYDAMTRCFISAMSAHPRYQYNVFFNADHFMGRGGVAHLLKKQHENVGVLVGPFPMVKLSALRRFLPRYLEEPSRAVANTSFVSFVINNVHPELLHVNLNVRDGKVVPYPWLIWAYPRERLSIYSFLPQAVMVRYPDTDGYIRARGSIDGGNFVSLLGYPRQSVHVVPDASEFPMVCTDESDRQIDLQAPRTNFAGLFIKCAATFDSTQWAYLGTSYQFGTASNDQDLEKRVMRRFLLLRRIRWMIRGPWLTYYAGLRFLSRTRRRIRSLSRRPGALAA